MSGWEQREEHAGQLREREGLEQEGGYPTCSGVRLDAPMGRHHQDREGGLARCAQRGNQSQTIEPRHIVVGDHEIDL